MSNTPHGALVQALARIDQLVATAQSFADKPGNGASLRILALLKDIQISTEVAEVALRALHT